MGGAAGPRCCDLLSLLRGGSDLDRGVQAELSDGTPDPEPVAAGNGNPAFLVPSQASKLRRGTVTTTRRGACRDVDVGEAGQPAGRPFQFAPEPLAAGRGLEVELHGLATVARSGVGDGDLDLEVAVCRPSGRRRSSRSAKSSSRGRGRTARPACGRASPSRDSRRGSTRSRRRSRRPWALRAARARRARRREGPGQASGRLEVTGEHGGERVPHLLPGEPDPEHGLRAFEPGQDHRARRRSRRSRHPDRRRAPLRRARSAGRAARDPTVPALRLDLFVRADDDHCQFGEASRVHGGVRSRIDVGTGRPVAEAGPDDGAVAPGTDDEVGRLDDDPPRGGHRRPSGPSPPGC